MSDSSDNVKYKWTPDSTSLLVSVWADRQVQKQLEYATKPQLIWESVARYMRKKGYEVTAKQCRSRMKQVLVCYKEAKKSGTRAGVERYYESIDKVLESKRIEKNIINDNGVDTVDSTKVIKSPPKEIKTNVNIRMRQNKFDDPINKNIEVIPGDWQFEHDEYADSSESNETVLARPVYRCFSPMKNAGTSTITDTMPLNKTARRSLLIPSDERIRYENGERYFEIPTKNSVQNVQNQIIQENMMLKTQLRDNIQQQQPEYRPLNINPRPQPQQNILYHPNRVSTNMQRIQSQLQHYCIGNNGARPQEPRKIINPDEELMRNEMHRYYSGTDEYPDMEPNLNQGFISVKNNKAHNLNETYDQTMFGPKVPWQADTTTITNNATFNDDTLSIEFLQDSPSPSENEGVEVNGKSNSYDNRTIPNAPVRTKKIQKLEQLMLNAISSQTEVVNKILAAQDIMVSRILDFDKDRQSRLEDRLNQLMTVVQATVAKKETEPEEVQQINFPTCFSPPPKPGAVPPKLDLVPPKPCRVPCTSPGNVELINQNPVQTRPGVIGPTKPGTIWTKLGPVSQSPFVRAQQQISAVTKAAEHWRTQSSAERRIAQACSSVNNIKSLITETIKFVNNEKLIEERIENARRTLNPEKDQTARRKLFEAPEEKKEPGRKEPCAAIVLTSAFLDIERQAEEKSRYVASRYGEEESNSSDDLLTGQGESYDRLRRLSIRRKPKSVQGNILGDKLDTSTPAKTARDNCNNNNNNNNNYDDEPRQTIQQLADLVMKSARFRNVEPINPGNQQKLSVHFPQRQDLPTRPTREKDRETQRQSCNKAYDWLTDRYSYGDKQSIGQFNEPIYNAHPIGFTAANLNINDENIVRPTFDRQVGFRQDMLKKYQELNDIQNIREMKNRELIDIYAPDSKPRRRGSGDDDDEEFLDTTTTLQPYRKTSSLTSSGTEHSAKAGTNCVIS
ncbi:GSCOCG00005107001-RA-CDS [Cotesia congregata]|nr:GSCOCG00005107001-RA-CDS [Cotesia congregata]